MERESGERSKVWVNPDQYIPPKNSELVAVNALQTFSMLLAERIIAHAKVELPVGFMDEWKEEIRNDGIPILVTNHTSHADAAASAKLINMLRESANTVLPKDDQMQMFTAPLAASLESGHQGPYLRQVYLGAKPVIERAGFMPNPIVRPQDMEKYGLIPNEKQYLRMHKQRLQSGHNGTLIYAEGTTEGGKTGPNGLPIGMVKFGDSIPIHIRLAKDYTHKPVFIVYAGIMGSSGAIDANTKKTPYSRIFDTCARPGQFHIRVGGIIKTDEQEYASLRTFEEINNFLGRKIASQLPEEMRGVYGV